MNCSLSLSGCCGDRRKTCREQALCSIETVREQVNAHMPQSSSGAARFARENSLTCAKSQFICIESKASARCRHSRPHCFTHFVSLSKRLELSLIPDTFGRDACFRHFNIEQPQHMRLLGSQLLPRCCDGVVLVQKDVAVDQTHLHKESARGAEGSGRHF